jgi:hypothetical protein
VDQDKLLQVTEDVKINLYPFFEEEKIKKAYVEVYQVVGLRPIAVHKFEITDLSPIVIPVSFMDNPNPQTLLLRIAKKKREAQDKLNDGIACLDTLQIKIGSLEEQASQLKKVVLSYSILLNNHPIKPDKISFTELDSMNGHQLFIGDAYLNTTLTLTYHDTTYTAWIRVKCRSSQEQLEISILPDAMKLLTENASIIRINQINSLSLDQRHRFLKAFPQYTCLFDPAIQFQSIKAYPTKHIVLFKMSDQQGIHFTGADSSD